MCKFCGNDNCSEIITDQIEFKCGDTGKIKKRVSLSTCVAGNDRIVPL